MKHNSEFKSLHRISRLAFPHRRVKFWVLYCRVRRDRDFRKFRDRDWDLRDPAGFYKNWNFSLTKSKFCFNIFNIKQIINKQSIIKTKKIFDHYSIVSIFYCVSTSDSFSESLSTSSSSSTGPRRILSMSALTSKIRSTVFMTFYPCLRRDFRHKKSCFISVFNVADKYFLCRNFFNFCIP
jgi:hypothetical protein